MKIQILDRWNASVKFECELSAEAENWSFGLRLGFAAKEALKSGANLRDANLRDADLSYADLREADLREADLRGANLRGANLRDVREDMIAEILKLPNELEYLRLALIEGRVDGSTYQGDCACLAGTLANAKGIANYSGDEIASNGAPFIADSNSLRETFFLSIRKGDTPETNPAAKIALKWVDEAIAIRDHIRKTAPV